MSDLYLGLSFESGYKLRYKAMSLIHIIVLMLNPVSVINELFSDIILKEPAYYFQEVSFISIVGFNIYN